MVSGLASQIDSLDSLDSIDQIPIIVFSPTPNSYLQQVRKGIQQRRKSTQAVISTSASDVREEVEKAGSAVLLMCIQNSSELKASLKCLRDLQDPIREHSLQVLCMTDADTPRAIQLLKARGCQRVLPSRLTWEALEENLSHSVSDLITDRMMAAQFASSCSSLIPLEPKFPEEAPFCSQLNQILKVWVALASADDAKLIEAKMIEFGEDSVVLDIAARGFKQGETILLVLENVGTGQKGKVKIPVALSSIIPTPDSHEIVSIAVEEALKSYLRPSKDAYQRLQTEITDFLKAARGW